MIQGTYHLLGETAIPFSKLLEIWAFVRGGANIFLLVLVDSVDLVRSFSRNFEFYSFMFKHKISTQLVCVNSISKHPLSVNN